jgi:hypothetical protein
MTDSFVLRLGSEQSAHVISGADQYLRAYQSGEDRGHLYLDYQAGTPRDKIVSEDLTLTLMVGSVGWRAFRSVKERGEIEIGPLPQKALEETSAEERRQVAAQIGELVQLRGFSVTLASRVLHKKRPALIPILDERAIFGAYMNPRWPQEAATSERVKSEGLIGKALDWIAFDLNRPENVAVWNELQAMARERSRIQIFESVWWMYFQEHNPKKEQSS